MIRYGIYPPRFKGGTIFYRDITVMVIDTEDDNKLIGAYLYQYDGSKVPISFNDLEYDKKMVTYFSGVQDVDKDDFDQVLRKVWVFDNEMSAFIQKVVLLNHIRTFFTKKQKDEKRFFDTKIPPQIEDVITDIRQKNPEYFL